MVTHYEINRQLKAIGSPIRWWGRAEVRELEHIIVPGETIRYCLNGRYAGGFAMLCITDQRVILIDKKPLYLTLEDIRYDMIAEVDFDQRLIDSTIHVITPSKKLSFTSFKAAMLRKATSYLQNRVMEFRQQHMMQPQDQGQYQQYEQGKLVNKVPQAVTSLQHRVINPYTRVPLMMRRRISRFPS